MAFKDDLKKWQGTLRQKEGADIIGVPLGTYRSWIQGKKTPRKLTMLGIVSQMKAHHE